MKRVLLVSVGLLFVGGYLACLPADPGTTTGTAGTHGSAGTNGTAGTQGNAAGTTGNTAGTTGNTAGTTGNTAGTFGTAGTNGNTAGTTGNTAGTTGNTAGTTGNTAGTTGTGTAGRGGTTGTGGRGGAAGTAAAGTTGAGGRGGAAGTAAAGTTGAGGGGGVDIHTADVLDGFMFLGKCLGDSQPAVCGTVNGTCPGANTADRALSGVLTTDKTVTLGGTSGTMYSVTLHVQGEVESKQYGGMDQNATKTSPAADGFCIGGTPTTADNYNVYMIRVTNPGTTTKTDYFLNSLQGPGVSNHTTYGIDYTAVIKAQGGATIRLVAGDSNCSMIKNCGPTVNDGNTCAAPIILANVEPTSVTKNPTFNFTTAYNGQWIVLTVKGVTSP